MNLREKFAMALKLRGETPQPSHSRKYLVLSRKAGGYYFLGASGAVRIGQNATTSRAVGDKFKAQLLAEADQWLYSGSKPSYSTLFEEGGEGG